MSLDGFDALKPENTDGLNQWMVWLRDFHVFFCAPLDLDFSMLKAFPRAYQVVEPGRQGPSAQGDPRDAVLGEDGLPHLYGANDDLLLRWYRYLFLGRGKPSTHARVLSNQDPAVLAAGAPLELRLLLTSIVTRLAPPPEAAV
jgi:putative ATP-dependent endonuclease of the OLD family